MSEKKTPLKANGTPKPFGANALEDGINFSIFSKNAASVILCLFLEDKAPFAEIPLNPDENKTGDVWHIFLYNLPKNLLYGYKIDGKLLLDPYAKTVIRIQDDPLVLLGEVSPVTSFDWKGAKNPEIPIQDLIIYEMHTKGFNGTFLGIIEKIPYLKELGINAIELLPVNEFDRNEYKRINPMTGKRLCNYWGYSSLNFFSLATLYTKDSPIIEFKTLVRELHLAGIEIILDVVFNHTGEGNELGPTISFKGIDNAVYYILGDRGQYLNFSGCGNTLNCNHPVVAELILEALRYFVVEMHVDGFRFDLASILNRDTEGGVLKNSSIVDFISEDPILSQVKLIAEPWDAAGFYQVGAFHPNKIRWSEWNGRYRDAMRYFLNGLKKDPGKFATRISGSEDLYYKRAPFTSINFITSHDGFTLRDLVSYNQKHNLGNAEDNKDGTNQNMSFNFGVEGQTHDPIILSLREQQMRNFHVALMISQGVPMIHMGDEYGHTKYGNNNTWCQDNEISWFLWDKLEENKGFYRFYRKMIELRKKYSCFRHRRFLTDKDITWHGLKPFLPNFTPDHSFIAFTLTDHEAGLDFYIAFNAENDVITMELPPPKPDTNWHLVVNTANCPPLDYIDEADQVPFESSEILMAPFSSVILRN